jgi:hypothetical protein
MAAGACVLFLAADGVGLLFAARALHGAAVGTAMLGTFRTITALAAPGQRAGLIARPHPHRPSSRSAGTRPRALRGAAGAGDHVA